MVRGRARQHLTPLSSHRGLTVTPANTTKYWVQIRNDCGAVATSDTITITVRPCTAPRIVIQPSNIDVVAGSTGAVAATISGTQPLTFQWFEGARLDTAHPVTKATTASFTTDPIFSPTTYWLRATNECGQVETQAVQVSVVQSCSTPVITTSRRTRCFAGYQRDPLGLRVRSVTAVPLVRGFVFVFSKPSG